MVLVDTSFMVVVLDIIELVEVIIADKLILLD